MSLLAFYQTGAIGIDAVFDTNSARAVGNAGDYVKDKLGT